MVSINFSYLVYTLLTPIYYVNINETMAYEPKNSKGAEREHLFLSYASEDWVFADWLALKLASEGYYVWYDRLKMLGGESYPLDISEAIQKNTFRVIALLSKNSILKPNPVKERTLALNVSKKLGIKNFLIPLNIDGLQSAELDFLMSDLVYISFYKSWYDGFGNLIKKLNQINTPNNIVKSRKSLSQWLFSEEHPTTRHEKIWSNLIPILEFPKIFKRFEINPKIKIESFEPDWIFFKESENTILTFTPPNITSYDWLTELEDVDVQLDDNFPDRNLRNATTRLLLEGLKSYCKKRGLTYDYTGKELYFPPDLLPNNKLYFNRYDGRKVYVNVVGERKFWVSSGGNKFIEISRYHLSPDFRFFANLIGKPVIRLRISVFWTNLEGFPLESKTANRRRKILCKDWWNYQWLSRTMAIMQWLGDGEDEITLVDSDSGKLRISLKPVSFISEFGIDEETLAVIEEDDVILDDSEEVEEDASTV